MTIPNQAPDSSQRGFLQPVADPLIQLESQNLEDFIQQFVAGVSGLDGTVVLQRWQPEPANLPDWGVDWCAVGVMRHRPLGPFAWVGHHPDGNGWDELQRHEELEILASYYGPNADMWAGNLHDGLMISQNLEILFLTGMGLVEITDGVRTPELIRERWWERVDKTILLNRIIRRYYPVLNLLSAAGWVKTDVRGYQTPFDTAVPPPPVPKASEDTSKLINFAALDGELGSTIWDNATTIWDSGTTVWDVQP